jgi:hypothetical protein
MLHSEELCDVYRSVGVVRVVKCRRLQWTGLVGGMGKTMNDTKLTIHFALPAVASPFLIGVKFVSLS